MSTNKNAIIRYQTLDRCFQNFGKRFYIEDLLEACNNALTDINPSSEGIKKRQLYEDIKFMESNQGWDIELEKIKDGRRAYYRYADKNYSINKQPITEIEAEQIKSAMLVLSRFKGLPQFEWINELIPKLNKTFHLKGQEDYIISFDNNEYLKGKEFITPLFSAIKNKQALLITYTSFQRDEAITLTFSPYHLKQYNNRWFLLGKQENLDSITNLALDRINTIEFSSANYDISLQTNFDEYFEDCIGVTKPINEQPILVELLAKPKLAPYIKTKPLHGSQKRIEETEKGYCFSIEVIPNYELEKLLLSFGEDLRVMNPALLKNKLKKRIQEQLTHY
ncbi:helix-turn-helix transcriptional regulator [Tenacibaculum sp.]|uniref:helix-turn-helix transcriptional regulator n=1 Tax=Tenacibaculum sp. TaxID=1906242 RepID=UPI003AA7E5C7